MASKKHYVQAARELNDSLKRSQTQENARGLLEGARIMAYVFATESGNRFNRQRFYDAVTEGTDHVL